jgi:hypothetical protein
VAYAGLVAYANFDECVNGDPGEIFCNALSNREEIRGDRRSMGFAEIRVRAKRICAQRGFAECTYAEGTRHAIVSPHD